MITPAAVPIPAKVSSTEITDIEAWLKEGRHLPKALRDFHHQKDLFRAMHQILEIETHEFCKDINWVEGHAYVIDIFLWWMARRGYTLQKTRTQGPFRDLEDDIRTQNDIRNAQFTAALKQMLQPSSNPNDADT